MGRVAARRLARLAHRRAAQDHGEDLLAHADEIGRRLHRARIAPLDEAPAEVERVFVRDAARAGRHHDEMRGEEQRLLHRMRDEEAHLARRVPDVEDRLLDRLPRERVERAQRLVHQQELRDRWRAPARCRRAAACRPTARRPRDPPTGRGRRDEASPARSGGAPPPARRASAARTRRCRQRRARASARASGTRRRGRRRDPSPAARRAGSCPRSAAGTPRCS